MWLPAPGFDAAGAVHRAVRPCPALHPNILVAGEAVSSHQGWAEGALETADLACERLRGLLQAAAPVEHVPRRRATPGVWVVYQGEPVYVPESWVRVHPGTSKALEKYAGRDVTPVFAVVHGTRLPLRVLFSLLAASPLPVSPSACPPPSAR